MRQCLFCGKEFKPGPKQQAKKFCTASCSDKAQWQKRKAGLVNPLTREKYIAKEFFDWREYPDNILI